MSGEEILFDAEERMDKAIGVLKTSLAGIRTGRANPGLVDSLRVDAYGSTMPIKQLASVGAPEPTQIVVRPYDPSVIKDIEKAIISIYRCQDPVGRPENRSFYTQSWCMGRYSGNPRWCQSSIQIPVSA